MSTKKRLPSAGIVPMKKPRTSEFSPTLACAVGASPSRAVSQAVMVDAGGWVVR